MTTQELERQLLSLSPDDQLAAIRVLLQAMSEPARGITKTPGVMGGDACIAKTRIPVWLLVSYRQQGMSDGQILEGYPDLTATDLVEAWAYAKVHTDEIVAALKAQEDADEEDMNMRETA
ncbi:MAG: DUF433 domain-containing protein [Cyanobacteria bacterium J06635_1]